MVAVSAACVNVADIPEAAFSSQRSSRRSSRKQRQAVAKLFLDFTEVESHDEISGGKPDLEAMFPGFDADLVQSIVSETPTWEKALSVLLALADNEQHFEDRQSPLAKDPLTDHAGFPALLDADGWEVVRGVDFDEKDNLIWSDVVRDVAKCMHSIRKSPECHSSAVFKRLPGAVAEIGASEYDRVEVETEHECRQRRGVERRLNSAKHDRRPATTCSGLPEVKKEAGKQNKTCKDSSPPAWRLCRFEDKL